MDEEQDVLTVLARSRPAALDPAELGGSARQRAQLQRILADPGDRRTGRTKRYRAWWIGVPVSAVAAAAAVTVAVAGAGTPAVRPSPAPVADSGQAVLRQIADRAQHQPAAPTAGYWQVQTTDEALNVGGTAPSLYAVPDADSLRTSVAARPGLASVDVSELPADRSTWWRPRDEARWQAAGAPDPVPWVRPGSTGPATLDLHGPDRPRVSSRPYDGRAGIFEGVPYTFAQFQRMPTDEAGLRTELDRLGRAMRAGSTAPPRTPPTSDPGWAFYNVTDLLTQPISPGTRAAALRILADLPGAVSLGTVTDPAGRAGFGLAVPDGSGDTINGGPTRFAVVVDPDTGALLAREQLITVPAPAETAAGIPVGTPVVSRTYDWMRWSDAQIATR
jgi:hypothetical protein